MWNDISEDEEEKNFSIFVKWILCLLFIYRVRLKFRNYTPLDENLKQYKLPKPEDIFKEVQVTFKKLGEIQDDDDVQSFFFPFSFSFCFCLFFFLLLYVCLPLWELYKCLQYFRVCFSIWHQKRRIGIWSETLKRSSTNWNVKLCRPSLKLLERNWTLTNRSPINEIKDLNVKNKKDNRAQLI